MARLKYLRHGFTQNPIWVTFYCAALLLNVVFAIGEISSGSIGVGAMNGVGAGVLFVILVFTLDRPWRWAIRRDQQLQRTRRHVAWIARVTRLNEQFFAPMGWWLDTGNSVFSALDRYYLALYPRGWETRLVDPVVIGYTSDPDEADRLLAQALKTVMGTE